MANNTALNAGCGTQAAGLSSGGYSYTIKTEEYNGISWEGSNSLIGSRQNHGSCGTQTAGLCFGGESSGGDLSSTEEYA